MVTQEIKKISSEIVDKIITIRRKIHMHPELGFKEFETSSLIADYLHKLGIEVKAGIAGTGVCGLLKGTSPGKTIAIRADIDALPIVEANTFHYISQNPGVMHACGHDAHISVALGAAEILSKLRHTINGNIKFIFQPGEEGLGGAKHMIDEGIMDAPVVDAIIAAHVSPALKTGQISILPGPIMASPSEFEIVIKGKGGHAAEPQNAVDPISIGVNLINLFQTIISREKDPLKSAVLSVTYFHAGSSYNIIPDTAVIKGTVRTFDSLVDKIISQRMERIASSTTAAMGGECEFTYMAGYPVLVNDAQTVKQIIASAGKIIEKENVITDIDPTMKAEDFAYYTQKAPGALFNLGCGNVEEGIIHGLHSNKFKIDEGCLKVGMEIMSQCAIDFLTT